MKTTNKSVRKSTKAAVSTVKRSVGRPAVELNLNFGDRPFTVKDIRNRYAKSPTKLISSVALTQKMKKIIVGKVENKDGKILVVFGRKISGRGRPFTQFKWVTAAEAARLVSQSKESVPVSAVAE